MSISVIQSSAVCVCVCGVSFHGSLHRSRPREIKRHVFSIIHRVPGVANSSNVLFIRIVASRPFCNYASHVSRIGRSLDFRFEASIQSFNRDGGRSLDAINKTSAIVLTNYYPRKQPYSLPYSFPLRIINDNYTLCSPSCTGVPLQYSINDRLNSWYQWQSKQSI